MAVEFPGNPYSKMLRESSETIAPSNEQCDRILQAVLTATDQPSVHYERAVADMERLAKPSRKISHLVITGAGAAIIAAGLLLVINFNANLTSSPTFIIGEEGVPLTDGVASFPLAQEYSVSLSEADSALATILKGYELDGAYICVYLDGTVNDIQWESIYATVGERKISPTLLDAQRRMIMFSLQADSMDIVITSAAGNRAVITVQPE